MLAPWYIYTNLALTKARMPISYWLLFLQQLPIPVVNFKIQNLYKKIVPLW